MDERKARTWPIKSAQVGFLTVHLMAHRACGTCAFQSRSPQHRRRVRTDGVKAASLTAAKEASVFSPRRAGSRSPSCQLLPVNLLFCAHPAPLQPITGAAVFRYCSQSCFDMMYLLCVIRASFPPRGQNALNFSCPDWCSTWKWHLSDRKLAFSWNWAVPNVRKLILLLPLGSILLPEGN